MDWQEYEKEIETHFRECYPNASIKHDAQVPGRLSKVKRQVDLLVEDQFADLRMRIVVDAKHRGRKLDVHDVEAFLAFLDDVGAHIGMMISLSGYTQAALNRAHADNRDVYLEILNFKDLKDHQGLAAIPYSGTHGVCVAAPLGWVIDGAKNGVALATSYQRGLSLDDALKKGEWMYINFSEKNESFPNLDSVLQEQETYLRDGSDSCKLEYLDGVVNQISGAQSLIRKLEKTSTETRELTGFVDFPDFVFLCVIFTTDLAESVNLRRLRFVMRGAFEMKIVQGSTNA